MSLLDSKLGGWSDDLGSAIGAPSVFPYDYPSAFWPVKRTGLFKGRFRVLILERNSDYIPFARARTGTGPPHDLSLGREARRFTKELRRLRFYWPRPGMEGEAYVRVRLRLFPPHGRLSGKAPGIPRRGSRGVGGKDPQALGPFVPIQGMRQGAQRSGRVFPQILGPERASLLRSSQQSLGGSEWPPPTIGQAGVSRAKLAQDFLHHLIVRARPAPLKVLDAPQVGGAQA